MNSQKDKRSDPTKNENSKKMRNDETISYRLKCPRTANGLSHFVMYGDIKEKETLL